MDWVPTWAERLLLGNLQEQGGVDCSVVRPDSRGRRGEHASDAGGARRPSPSKSRHFQWSDESKNCLWTTRATPNLDNACCVARRVILHEIVQIEDPVKKKHTNLKREFGSFVGMVRDRSLDTESSTTWMSLGLLVLLCLAVFLLGDLVAVQILFRNDAQQVHRPLNEHRRKIVC